MESRDKSLNAPGEQHAPTSIVCLYATRDEPMYRDLQTHLVLWQTKGHIRWLELSAGADVEQSLLAFVQEADCVLLLISSSFFATSTLHRLMESALAEQAKRGVPVVPILARAFDWKESACGGLRTLPDNERPIAEWEHRERAYENIRAGLVRLIPGLSADGQSGCPRLFQARDLPTGYIDRPKAFDAIKQLLLSHQNHHTTAITTALRGAGGFGKTTLAIALCHDPEIQAAFPDGILWVELGEQPPRTLDLLNSVLASLDGAYTEAIRLEEARDHWRTALQDRICLLVIDDVWRAEALTPLLEFGPQCVRLITTRNDRVLPEDTVRIWVDAMEPIEARALLSRGLPDEVRQTVHQIAVKHLMKRLGCWPLLLTLANGMLVAQVRHGRALTQALALLEQAYDTRGVLAFDPGNLTERQRAVQACIEVSLRHLEDFTSSHSHAVQRYLELAVFPEDIAIPLETLQRFWHVTGGLETWEVDDLCMHLHDLSLLLVCDLSKGTIRLHDVLRSYLIQRTGSQIGALHVRFLDICQQVLKLKRWADLPQSETYLWYQLIPHLCQAGRQEALQTTLTDLGYLTRKALYIGVSALEADLLLASMVPPAGTAESAPSFFAFLHRCVGPISHLLRQIQTEAEMGGVLLSYLGWESAFAAQRYTLERELPRPFLTAWHPLPGISSAALLRTLQGHTKTVHACAVSPDGRFIVSASSDHTLKVWDATTGAERLSLTGHTSTVRGCAVSPDGRWIVSASGDLFGSDHTLKVWDAATGAERLTLQGHTKTVHACAVSPDGRFIVSASEDKTLKLWDAATGAERLTLQGHTKTVHACAVSPDGRWIVSASGDLFGDVFASSDDTLKVWDAATGAERLTLMGHTSAVNGCAVSPDGRWIVSASSDHTLKVWDAATGAERLSLTGHTSEVRGCAVSLDGRFIVSASSDHTLKVWDATTGAERLTLTGHTSAVNGCAVSPDGRWIVSACGNSFGSDHTLKVWDAATRAERLSLTGHTGEVRGCAVSLDGRFIVSASSDHTLKVWDATTGAERLTLTGHTGVVRGCAVSPDGRFIVSASSDDTLKVWDAATGAERLSLTGHTGVVRGCAVSLDGRFIVSASSDHTLKVWDATTGAERLTLTGHTSAVNGCAVSPDGRWIVSASGDLFGDFFASSDDTLKVWDAATGAERLSLSGHTSAVNGCAVSPDEKWIVSASSDQTLKVWDAQTGQCMLTFPVDGRLFGCAFHPDGKHLVACGEQGVYFLRLVA